MSRLISYLAGGLLLLAPRLASACPTCGQGYSFTPKILFISTSFFLLPIVIVGFIGWRVWKGETNPSKEDP